MIGGIDYSKPWYGTDGTIHSGCEKCYGKGFFLLYTIPNVTQVYNALGDFVGLADERRPVIFPCPCSKKAPRGFEPSLSLVDQSIREGRALHWFLDENPAPPAELVLPGRPPRRIANPAAFMADLQRRFGHNDTKYGAAKDIFRLYSVLCEHKIVSAPQVVQEEDAFAEVVEEDAFPEVREEDAFGPDQIIEEDAFA